MGVLITNETLNSSAIYSKNSNYRFNSMESIYNNLIKKDGQKINSAVDYIGTYFMLRDRLCEHPEEFEEFDKISKKMNTYAKDNFLTGLNIEDFYNITHSNEYQKVVTREVKGKDFKSFDIYNLLTKEQKKIVDANAKAAKQHKINIVEEKFKNIAEILEMPKIGDMMKTFDDLNNKYIDTKNLLENNKKKYPNVFKKEDPEWEGIDNQEESFDFSRDEGLTEDEIEARNQSEYFDEIKNSTKNAFKDMYAKLKYKDEHRTFWQRVFHPFNTSNEKKLLKNVEDGLKGEFEMTAEELDKVYNTFSEDKNTYIVHKQEWDNAKNKDKSSESLSGDKNNIKTKFDLEEKLRNDTSEELYGKYSSSTNNSYSKKIEVVPKEVDDSEKML